jgi:hypothetical protein
VKSTFFPVSSMNHPEAADSLLWKLAGVPCPQPEEDVKLLF